MLPFRSASKFTFFTISAAPFFGNMDISALRFTFKSYGFSSACSHLFDTPAQTLCSDRMKLNDHPLMSHKGLRNWPPSFLAFNHEDRLAGELGILRHVMADQTDMNRVFLLTEYDGLGYVGCVQFDDKEFCSRIATVFRNSIGKPLKEIGEFEIV
jgi:hypothetical protein